LENEKKSFKGSATGFAVSRSALIKKLKKKIIKAFGQPLYFGLNNFICVTIIKALKLNLSKVLEWSFLSTTELGNNPINESTNSLVTPVALGA